MTHTVDDTGDLALAVNPFDPTFKADPYPVYARLRAELPIHRSALGAWIVADYASCDKVLRSRSFGKDFANSTFFDHLVSMMGEDMPPFLGLGIDGDARPFMLTDPPEHTRLRGLVSDAFTRSTTTSMDDIVLSAASSAVRHLEHCKDAVSEVAEPFPVEVLSSILGIPDEDRGRFSEWSNLVAGVLDINFAIPKEVADRRSAAIEESIDYFRTLATSGKAPEGLVRRLSEVSHGGDQLSVDEIAATCLLITVAGQETTSNTIGNMLIAFSRHADQFEQVRANPQFIENAVAEVLRFEPPAHEAGRIALEDCEVSGANITKGDAVMVLLASGNREAVERGDTFSVTRRDVSSLSYGRGIHHCLGSALANSMLQHFLRELSQRYRSLEVAEPINYKPGMGLRGPETLSVAISR
ncbi:cytochrome P450 [Rhodococcus sp. IEGM 1409]|uniref:cytochrome P450 n=1 Tax=Rhodococcus sp. IEGM 1409 TaxID=3047082 RepID=UPI0024B75685|nr:cytochrome P450 [Rhodococcus sp. IEGM 1409]MDI9900512.1 cytochrome P450 [Rhodococcus sp. IEGM 1409]